MEAVLQFVEWDCRLGGGVDRVNDKIEMELAAGGSTYLGLCERFCLPVIV